MQWELRIGRTGGGDNSKPDVRYAINTNGGGAYA